MNKFFESIVNWKLKKGSHEFPGPNGGTCINEAAIVAAGFEYKAVGSAEDCPPCFSRPLAQIAIGINDVITEDFIRQRLLMPFVVRLSGTRDKTAVELRRCEYIHDNILALSVPYLSFVENNVRMANIIRHDFVAALSDMDFSKFKTRAYRNATLTDAIIHWMNAITSTMEATSSYLHEEEGAYEKYFGEVCAVLDGAIRMGTHQTIEEALACNRLEQASVKAAIKKVEKEKEMAEMKELSPF